MQYPLMLVVQLQYTPYNYPQPSYTPAPAPWGFMEYTELTVIAILVLWFLSIISRPPRALKNWHHPFPGVQFSSKEIYQRIIDEITERQMIGRGVSTKFAKYFEAGLFTPRREYLTISYKKFTLDVCCISFGTGYYISWWLGEDDPGIFSRIPIIKDLFGLNPEYQSYYQLDTATLFQSGVHNAILKVIDDVSNEHGYRLLTELERMPSEGGMYMRKR